jgi:alcohol dehydrogenase class IV
MVSPFEFATATRVLFGAGSIQRLPALAAELGRRPLLVTGRDPARAARVASLLGPAARLAVSGEPTLDVAREGVALARGAGCDLIVACGGGSAIDTGKAIAALLGNGGDPLDYLEVIGRGQPLTRPSLPFIAAPTTAGTGAEVTRNAVLCDPARRAKASLRSPLMLPTVALLDPDLLGGAPPAVLASAGLDALSQLIEPFVSLRRNPLTDALCREGMRRSARSLRRAYLEGPDAAARDDLALASLFSGLCLANAGLGAVHGFAAPLGGMFAAPHGAVCAALLPSVMRVNAAALRARAPDHEALPRYKEIAALLTGDPGASIEDGVRWVEALVRDLRVPGLAAYGLRAEDIPPLLQRAREASSMKGNPLPLTDAELREIAEASS